MLLESILKIFLPKWLDKIAEAITIRIADKDKELSNLTDTFGDPYLLSKYYIEPECQHINPANEDDDDPSSVVTSPISKTINRFVNRDFLNKRDGRSHMFVLGDAGMGKTSFLLTLKMAHMSGLWPSGYDCHLFKLGKNTIDDIVKIKSKSKAVLLLDALDEDTEAWRNVKDRIVNLIALTNGFYRVIITCRTQYFPDDEGDPYGRISQGKIRLGAYVCPSIYMSPFNDEQVFEYLEKRFSGEDEDKREQLIQKAISIVNGMESLKFRPLLLSYIEDFLESENTDWDDYSIYGALVDSWLNREHIKLDEIGKSVTYGDLHKTSIYLAKLMQSMGVNHISEENIAIFISQYPELDYLEKFHIGGRALLNKNSKGEFRFSHYSIQEYLCAYGLVNGYFQGEEKSIRYSDRFLSFSLMKLKPETQHYLNAIDFGEANIKNLNFRGFRLFGVKFEGLNIIDCDFRESELTSVSFENSNLKNVKFDSSNLKSVNFNRCNMKQVSFHKSMLDGCEMIDTNASEVDLEDAILVNTDTSSVLKGTNINIYPVEYRS